MKRTLISLWKGEISPWEEISQTTPSQAPLLQALGKLSERLNLQLDQTGTKDLEKFQDLHADLCAAELENAFVKGFLLGARILLEIFDAEPS